MAEAMLMGVVACTTPEGRLIASVDIFAQPYDDTLPIDSKPLIVLSPQEARDSGEEPLQLRERGRYEYRLRAEPGAPDNLGLLAQRGIQPSRVQSVGEERGFIEPGDFCGLLPLTVICRNDSTERLLARGAVEVRSVKLGYREHYRGMMSFIAEKCAGLILDCRAPTQTRLDVLGQETYQFQEQQLEFLRYILSAPQFRAAVDQVLRNPHTRLEGKHGTRDISRLPRPDKRLAQQIIAGGRRCSIPVSHPLHSRLTSLPSHVSVQSRVETFDTPENRFAKMVLTEFHGFLATLAHDLSKKAESDRSGTGRLLREAKRLCAYLEAQLSRGFFPEVGMPTSVPLGSPVLQRRAGYRELLRYWLQFYASAQLAWDGGADVFAAGTRNVATLYEYWLFFQLEALFRQRFSCDQPLHALIVDRRKAPARLVLRRGVELKTPVSGIWSKAAGRHLRAELHFNRKFTARAERGNAGSWTRGVQPDFTLSIWPAEFSKDEAEGNELMVHVHFDAKYRVERVREIVGDEGDDDIFQRAAPAADSSGGVAKYQDLLKMHAYRDAIRRTAGAYVLYPGSSGQKQLFEGFHEILPGLGAFAILPSSEGKAEGMHALAEFLDGVVEHLSNRTTARERTTYHLAEAYAVQEKAVPYGSVHLAEADLFGEKHRALPPAESMVLVAWYQNEAQLALARFGSGFVYVRLGRRRGSFKIHPNLASVHYVLLRSHGGVVADGLLRLREPGFRVFTRKELRVELSQHAKGHGVALWESDTEQDEEYIYALFSTAVDLSLASLEWNGDALIEQIELFEADARNTPVGNLGRTSPYPRILPLRDVLKTKR